MFSAIIPAAGLGTRMGMKPDQSKELLLDLQGKPLIQWHLDLCKEYNLNPLVLVRPEKQDLIEYLKKQNIEPVIIGPHTEWMGAIEEGLKVNKSHYSFVLLPDTRFKDKNIINQMKLSLGMGNNLVLALHQVDDHTKWGMISKNYSIEKPEKNITSSHSVNAWGIIGFNSFYSDIKWFLDGAKTKNKPYYWPRDCTPSFYFLDKFVDVTRSGMIGLEKELKEFENV